jgi:hypothetical protein
MIVTGQKGKKKKVPSGPPGALAGRYRPRQKDILAALGHKPSHQVFHKPQATEAGIKTIPLAHRRPPRSEMPGAELFTPEAIAYKAAHAGTGHEVEDLAIGLFKNLIFDPEHPLLSAASFLPLGKAARAGSHLIRRLGDYNEEYLSHTGLLDVPLLREDQFQAGLKEYYNAYDLSKIKDTPVGTLEDIVSQLARAKTPPHGSVVFAPPDKYSKHLWVHSVSADPAYRSMGLLGALSRPVTGTLEEWPGAALDAAIVNPELALALRGWALRNKIPLTPGVESDIRRYEAMGYTLKGRAGRKRRRKNV